MLYWKNIFVQYRFIAIRYRSLSIQTTPQSGPLWVYSHINQYCWLIVVCAYYLHAYSDNIVFGTVNYHVALGLLVVQRLIIIDKWFSCPGYLIERWRLNVPRNTAIWRRKVIILNPTKFTCHAFLDYIFYHFGIPGIARQWFWNHFISHRGSINMFYNCV